MRCGTLYKFRAVLANLTLCDQQSVARCSRTRTAKKQNVAVYILHFEPAQPIPSIFERFGKFHIARRKFCCQLVWIVGADVSVPARPAFFDVSLVVWQRVNTNVLEHDHGGTPLDNAEEDVVRLGPLKRDVEPKPVAIKRHRSRDIL